MFYFYKQMCLRLIEKFPLKYFFQEKNLNVGNKLLKVIFKYLYEMIACPTTTTKKSTRKQQQQKQLLMEKKIKKKIVYFRFSLKKKIRGNENPFSY